MQGNGKHCRESVGTRTNGRVELPSKDPNVAKNNTKQRIM